MNWLELLNKDVSNAVDLLVTINQQYNQQRKKSLKRKRKQPDNPRKLPRSDNERATDTWYMTHDEISCFWNGQSLKYFCDDCDFTSAYKYNLQAHQGQHVASPKRKRNKPDNLSLLPKYIYGRVKDTWYRTHDKIYCFWNGQSLKYFCNKCDFSTGYKNSVHIHSKQHRDIDYNGPIIPYWETVSCTCNGQCKNNYCACRREGITCGPQCGCNYLCCKNTDQSKLSTKKTKCVCKKSCNKKYCMCFRRGQYCNNSCECPGTCVNTLDDSTIDLILSLS